MFAFFEFILACWLIADFLGGVAHWIEDRYFRLDWPLIGKHITAPNELHHREPRAFLNQGYWSRNWTAMALAIPLFLLTYAITLSPWCIALLFLSQANEIHAWSHQRCSGFIRVLQEIGLLSSCRQHGQHHKAPFDCRYCVLTDWLNPLLDYSRFWHGMETILGWCGVKVKETTEEPRND